MSSTLMFYLLLLSVLVLFSICGRVLVQWLVPECCYWEYWVVPLSFTVFYMVSFAFMFNQSLDTAGFMKRYLLFKAVKLLVLLTIMLLSAFVLYSEVEMFVAVFLIFYLLMIVPETICVVYARKRTCENR